MIIEDESVMLFNQLLSLHVFYQFLSM